MLIPLDLPRNFYHSILSTISLASKGDFIHLNYFVIREDNRGLALLATVLEALKKEVRIQIIVDSYGSMHPANDGTEYDGAHLSHELLNILRFHGAEVKIFHSIKSTDKAHYTNLLDWKCYTRRNHNKLFLYNLKSIDRKGIVVGDSQWAEEHFTNIFRGNNVLIEHEDLFHDALSYSQNLITSRHVQNPDEVELRLMDIESKTNDLENRFKNLKIDHNWDAESPIFYPNELEFVFNELHFDNPNERRTIQDREIELIDNAKNFIWYSTPYFGPDHLMRQAFIDAEKRLKLDLKILIAKFRTHPFLPYGTKRAATQLMQKGVKIYEYNGDGNIHYKDLLIDDISFIKSANGEGRSRFYNLETGVIIKCKDYMEYNKKHMKADILQSLKLHKNTTFLQEKHLAKRFLKDLFCPLYYRHL